MNLELATTPHPTTTKALSKGGQTVDLVIWWLVKPDDPTHPYNDTEREEEAWGDIARPASVRALQDASLMADWLNNDAIPELMAKARADGETWSDVADSLSITKQAAQQRFARWEQAQKEG